MKKFYYLLAAALFVAASCEKSPVDQGTTDAGNVYMQFSVKMLSTRSQTDENNGNSNSNADPDTEVGKDYENKISTVDIALVKDDQYFVSENVTIAEANKSTYVASFNSLNLKAGATYKVYIYANCKAPTNFNINEVSSATVASMTVANNFWMTNAYAAEDVTLPTDLGMHTTPQTPFNLGTHVVERSMARFDYKPSDAFDMGAGLTLTLTDAALINQSRAHYMFRRVTTNSEIASTPIVGGVEKPTNWVIDTDWASKTKDGFDAQLESPASWTWTPLASLKDKDYDNYNGEYKIWCYAKENTIPGVAAQKHNVSTGVVFKAELAAGEGASADVKAAMAAGSRIYVFNNVLYGAWKDVKKAAEAGTDATLQAAYNQAAATIAADKTEPAGADAAAAGFTGYSPEGGKYYVYYYYWNRHNDNLDNTVMGIMEFAVVRNNVYKLAVNAINRFGHPTPTPPDPTNPDPDPDPVDPDDPDESVNYYFNVTVKVLPWTVRINNIEF